MPAAANTECDRLAWTGTTPNGATGVYKKARNGEGAQVGVATWAPNTAGPNTEEWDQHGFKELLEGFEEDRILSFKVPGKIHRLMPAGEGYPGEGIAIKGSGPAKGLHAGIGCWWNTSNDRAICILDEEHKKKRVVEDLNYFAGVAVASFLS